MPRTNADNPIDYNGMTPLHHAIIDNTNNCGLLIEQGARIHKKITDGPHKGKNAIDLLCKYSAAFFTLNTKQIRILFSKITKEGLENEGEDKKLIDSLLGNFAPKLLRMLAGNNGEQRDNLQMIPVILGMNIPMRFGSDFPTVAGWYQRTRYTILESGFRASLSRPREWMDPAGIELLFEMSRNPLTRKMVSDIPKRFEPGHASYETFPTYSEDIISREANLAWALNYGASLFQRDEQDNTPLHLACASLNVKLVAEILELEQFHDKAWKNPFANKEMRRNLLTWSNVQEQTPLDIIANMAQAFNISLFAPTDPTSSQKMILSSDDAKTRFERKVAAEHSDALDTAVKTQQSVKRRKVSSKEEKTQQAEIELEKQKIRKIIGLLMNVIQPVIDHYVFRFFQFQFLSPPIVDKELQKILGHLPKIPWAVEKIIRGFEHSFDQIGLSRNEKGQIFACSDAGKSYIDAAYLKAVKSGEVIMLAAERLMRVNHVVCDVEQMNSMMPEMSRVYYEQYSHFLLSRGTVFPAYEHYRAAFMPVAEFSKKFQNKNIELILKLWDWSQGMDIEWAEYPRHARLFVSLLEKLNASGVDLQKMAGMTKDFSDWLEKYYPVFKQKRKAYPEAIKLATPKALSLVPFVAKPEVKRETEIVTLLHQDIEFGVKELAERCRSLLEQGADIEATDKDGLTALHLTLIHRLPILDLLFLKEDGPWKSANIHAVVPSGKHAGKTALQLIFKLRPPQLFPTSPTKVNENNVIMMEAVLSQLTKEDFTPSLLNSFIRILNNSSLQMLENWWGPLIRKYIPLQLEMGKNQNRGKYLVYKTTLKSGVACPAGLSDHIYFFSNYASDEKLNLYNFERKQYVYPEVSIHGSRSLNIGRYKGFRNEAGNTPLHMACIYGNAKLVATLLQCSDPKKSAGFDQLACVNFDGDTPLDIAMSALEAFKEGKKSNKIIGDKSSKRYKEILAIFRNVIQPLVNRAALEILIQYGMNEHGSIRDTFIRFVNTFHLTSAEFNVILNSQHCFRVLKECYARAFNSPAIIKLAHRVQLENMQRRALFLTHYENILNGIESIKENPYLLAKENPEGNPDVMPVVPYAVFYQQLADNMIESLKWDDSKVPHKNLLTWAWNRPKPIEIGSSNRRAESALQACRPAPMDLSL